MKRCTYCERSCADDSQVCPSCGASSFVQICQNCGNTVVQGRYCPICGVGIGQKPRICPICGKGYFSHACPDCGYVPGGAPPTYLHAGYSVPPAAAQPKKKKRFGLWVLGWIFIFPIPLTILMTRSRKLPLWARILIAALAWLIYLLIGMSG